MRKIYFFIYLILACIMVIYEIFPERDFPAKIPNSLQSDEPADNETPLRRGYYTDLSRGEVLSYYQDQFGSTYLSKFRFFSFRLNYPPEEAQTLIRDQTRSTFLEEIVIPFRESLYVNGFEPKEDKDRIIKEGKIWRQKVSVRLSNSNIFIRILFAILSPAMTLIVFYAWERSIVEALYFTKKHISRFS